MESPAVAVGERDRGQSERRHYVEALRRAGMD